MLFKKTKHGIKWAAGILISTIFIFLAFRKVELTQLVASFHGIKCVFLIPIFLSILLSDIMRSLRWQFFLAPIKQINLFSLFSALRIGYTANVILPAR